MSKTEMRQVFIWEDKSTWVSAKTNFFSHYSHVRGYHGCRPVDVESYYEDGLLPPEKERLSEHAVYTLSNDRHSKEKIEALFNKAWDNYYAKGLYFCLCKNELLDYCGHYLIYGSELICGIGRKLGLDTTLKSKGTPTLFSVDVPIHLIDENIILELRGKVRDSRRYKTPPSIDFGFRVTQRLFPDCIVACDHPQKIHDPLNWGSYYTHIK